MPEKSNFDQSEETWGEIALYLCYGLIALGIGIAMAKIVFHL